MVRFSCFSSHVYCPKPKKIAQPSVEGLQDFSEIQAMKDSSNSTQLKALCSSVSGDIQSDNYKHVASSSSVGRSWKSEEIKNKFNLENDLGVHQFGHLKKSQSLGSRLCWEGRYAGENEIEEETDQGFSSDSHDQNGLAVHNGSNNPVASPPSEHQKVPHAGSGQISSDHVNNEPIFSIGHLQNSEKEGLENYDAPISSLGNCVEDYVDHVSHTPWIVKSHSLRDIASIYPSGECSSTKNLVPHSRSTDDLQILDMRRKDTSVHDVDSQVMQEQERDDDTSKYVKNHFDTPVYDCLDSCNYSASAKDWIIPDEVDSAKNLQGEAFARRWDNLPSKDFKIKRIEEWVNDLQHCSPLEETDELSTEVKGDPDVLNGVLNGLTVAKADGKVTPDMEAAKRYISSLNMTATTAQLSNHGLVVIPFLSAFASMKVLNLSGNAIVRITAGALPRGLHMLNLSKNSISTIEGLRELTRLRVLDLSYNRIFRIGHGLASCSSLKELYLAGNKISEVEGLHRLLKLNVLDLRFNKISTAKCLGQLAANYNALQAISLEGNPAQKNVGDEQLKKYLQSLLPHLVYFNRQPMKASTLKDAADRSVRLGMSAHQFDRHSLRSDNKATRKSSHGVAGHRPSSSSSHGRKSQAVVSPPKRPRGRHSRLPPAGTKAATNHRHNYNYNIDLNSKLLNLKSEISMRRSRSEGTLGGV